MKNVLFHQFSSEKICLGNILLASYYSYVINDGFWDILNLYQKQVFKPNILWVVCIEA